MFQERLADALGQTAMHLAFDDHGVHDLAEVVHGHELVDAHHAGFGIHFHFADVGAGRVGEVRRIVERFFRKPGLQLLQRIVRRHIGGERHLGEGERLVGIHHAERAILERDLIFLRFQHVRRDFLAFGDDLVARLHQRGTAHRERARTVGAEGVVRPAGVAVQHRHVLERHAELVRDDLRERGFVALAVAVRAGGDGDGAGHVHAHFAHFKQTHAGAQGKRHLRGREAAGFNVAGEADAALLAVRFGFRPAVGKAGVVRVGEGFVQTRVVVAGVVGEGDGGFVRKVARLDEVAAAQIRGIHADFPRRGFHQPFHHVGGFRPAGASVRIHRRGVGEQRLHLHMDGRRLVLAGQQRAVKVGGHAGCERGKVGAHVGFGFHAQTEKLAILGQGEFGVGGVVAPVRIR